jgi:hypothetical protein
MILLLDKHNNVNRRGRCITIVAKLDVYLQGLIFMRTILLTVGFIVSSLICRTRGDTL